MAPGPLALVLVIGLLALVPTRRLHRFGWSAGTVGVYFVALWILGVVAASGGPGRILVPVLLVAWLAPFVTVRDGLDRLLGRRSAAPRNVTPGSGPQAGRVDTAE
jgi:hypothetical protein